MRRLACATCLLVVSLIASTAHADAVPPPPKSCPKGQVGVTSHSGPACVPQAPTDCAPGYRGQVGGQCVLASCHSDDPCDDGQRCMDVDTCQEFRELHWTGWGWGAHRPVQRGNFFAGPPRPRPEGPPKKAWVELNICGQDGACESPAECRPSSLCYPTSAIGKTKAKVVELGTARRAPPPEKASTPKTGTNDVSSAQPEDPIQPTTSHGDAADPAVADGGGCRKGCSVASTRADAGWVGVSVWVLAVLMLRRRRDLPAFGHAERDRRSCQPMPTGLPHPARRRSSQAG